MKQNPLVTIGLPVIKGCFLQKTIESLLYQSYQNIEIIILNDASKDDIDSIVQLYNDERIRYYKNAVNIGSSNLIKNWNSLVDYALGDFFIMGSDDDIYDHEFIKSLLKLSIKYPSINIFHSRVAIINEDDQIINLSPTCPEYEDCMDFIWHRINSRRLQFAPEFMIKTEAIKNIGGFIDFPVAWYSDDATWYSIAKSNGIAYTGEILFKWRLSGQNISSANNRIKEKIEAIYSFEEWLLKFLASYYTSDSIKEFQKRQIISTSNSRSFHSIVDILQHDNYLNIIKFYSNFRKRRSSFFIIIKAIMKKLNASFTHKLTND